MLLTERYQILCGWLFAPTRRDQRSFLENNLILLSPEHDQLLYNLMKESEYEHAGSEQYHLYSSCHALLQDVRKRGGKLQAVREAYVNEYGGFVLELPAWLAEIEYYLTYIFPTENISVRVKTRVKLRLREAIELAYEDDTLPLEVLAELHFLLAHYLAVDLSGQSKQQLALVVQYYEAALQMYPADLYPKQYLRLCSALDRLPLL